jgi:serpin B
MIQIGSNENLYVSKVIQKAFIEVNEEGAEAAASTEMEIMLDICDIPPADVFVDHAFQFMLQYKNGILFIGKILLPEKD